MGVEILDAGTDHAAPDADALGLLLVLVGQEVLDSVPNLGPGRPAALTGLNELVLGSAPAMAVEIALLGDLLGPDVGEPASSSTLR